MVCTQLHRSIDLVKEIVASFVGDLLNSHPILEEKGGKEGHEVNVVVAKVLEIHVDEPSEDP